MRDILSESLYVHIPFCRRRCVYCDFFSLGERFARWPEFVDALLREAEARLRVLPDVSRIANSSAVSRSFPTIYIGGGTPSLIPENEFLRLASGLTNLMGAPQEFTVEVNPDDVSYSKLSAWREAGVNRVSVGVQSLVDAELRFIGRRHDAEKAMEALRMLGDNFNNVSADLIFGLPLQTLDSLRFSLEKIMDTAPKHISIYSLMYEEKTALTRMRNAGKVMETDEAVSEKMFELICEMTRAAGYRHYEISNFALPGYESRHNSGYWAGTSYVGLGPGAHSYDGARVRSNNPPDINAYMRAWGSLENGENMQSEYAKSEYLDEDELREEMIITRMRMAEGLDLNEFSEAFGERACKKLLRESEKFCRDGMLSLSANHIRFTRKGIMISDNILSSLI
ncbi:MAG: radical SAM family heme chaperone HemW [Candidatus Amulumruptor caecigallinarius]|nr:radical SAM family heme chaperone HemW [Candidatus Amulumruptor caecigallinarius]